MAMSIPDRLEINGMKYISVIGDAMPLESIVRTALAQMIRAGAELDEADRLLTASDMGTEKWAHELAAWKRRKDAIVDCDRGTWQ